VRDRKPFCVREDRQHVCGGQPFSCCAQSDDARFDIGGRAGESSGRGAGGCESDLCALSTESFDRLDYAT
jgi:hypothetical protein